MNRDFLSQPKLYPNEADFDLQRSTLPDFEQRSKSHAQRYTEKSTYNSNLEKSQKSKKNEA